MFTYTLTPHTRSYSTCVIINQIHPKEKIRRLKHEQREDEIRKNERQKDEISMSAHAHTAGVPTYCTVNLT